MSSLHDLEPTPSVISHPRTGHDLGFSAPSPASTIHEPNTSTTESLEWDDVGTDLIHSTDPSYLDTLYDIPLDRVQNLCNILPIPHSLLESVHPATRLQPNLHEVNDLRFRLPLSSTPRLQRQRIPNQNHHVQEQETRRPSFISFLRRLNPFKKRDSGG